SSRRRHTRSKRDWSSDVCSSDLSSDSLRARSEGLRDTRSVVVASEPMDDDPAWRLMDSGELIHLGADGTLRSEHPFGPLAHALSLEELGLSAAASQAHAAQAREQEHRRRRLAEVGA